MVGVVAQLPERDKVLGVGKGRGLNFFSGKIRASANLVLKRVRRPRRPKGKVHFLAVEKCEHRLGDVNLHPVEDRDDPQVGLAFRLTQLVDELEVAHQVLGAKGRMKTDTRRGNMCTNLGQNRALLVAAVVHRKVDAVHGRNRTADKPQRNARTANWAQVVVTGSPGESPSPAMKSIAHCRIRH